MKDGAVVTALPGAVGHANNILSQNHVLIHQVRFCLGEETMFSSVQSLDRLGHQRDMRAFSAEILFQSFLQEALMSNSGMGRCVHSLCYPSSISWADHGRVGNAIVSRENLHD